MKLPTTEELDLVTILVTGDCSDNFEMITDPDKRLEIIKLAMSGELVEQITDLSCDLQTVAEWFEKSKVYWP